MTCGLFSGFVLGGRKTNITVYVGRTAITALVDLIDVSCTCQVITLFFLSPVLRAALAEAPIAYGMCWGGKARGSQQYNVVASDPRVFWPK